MDREKVVLRSEIAQFVDQLEQSVGQVADAMLAASEEMLVSSLVLESMSETAAGQATSAASASEQTSANVESIAEVAKNLDAAIAEINQRIHEQADLASDALERTNSTRDRMRQMEDESQGIGEVARLVTNIASQTNVLALNATIEAAHAGEVGRGFAVVAGEVKSLSNQSEEAARDISVRIDSVRARVHEAVGSMQGVVQFVDRSNESASAIAAAADEQSVATEQLAHNASEASKGTRLVSSSIRMLAGTALESKSAATQVSTVAHSLSRQSALLRKTVSSLIFDLRAV